MSKEILKIDYFKKGFNRTFKTEVVEGSTFIFIVINLLIYFDRLFSTKIFEKLLTKLPNVSFIIKNKVGLFLVNSIDDTISHCTEYFELNCHKWLDLPLPERNIFIDIGGNAGFYSILSSKKYDEVYCIEASAKMSEIIKANKALNDAKNIKIFNMAVSDQQKTLKFFENPYRTGLNHIVPESSNNKLSDKKITEVEAISLDHFLKQEEINISDIGMIKIDVEKHEYPILIGMKDTLQKTSEGSYLFLEILNRKEYNKFNSLLKKNRYECIEQQGRNYLFVKKRL